MEKGIDFCRSESEFRGNLQGRPGEAQEADEDPQCTEGGLARGTASQEQGPCLLHQCEFDYADVVLEVLTFPKQKATARMLREHQGD